MTVLVFYLLFSIHILFAVSSLGDSDFGHHPESNLYAFGDSNFEIGMKFSDHESWMKAGYPPYGGKYIFLDFYRFTNGFTIPEVIAYYLNKVLKSIDELGQFIGAGANFASASAGILPETGTTFGKNLCFKEQIGAFKEHVENDLKERYNTTELSKYLLNSIYMINIGESDYIYNYLQPQYFNTSHRYNGEEFAEHLTEEYGNYLKDLYMLGARKMVIFQIGPLGCLPYIIEKFKPRSQCAENINDLISIFNDKLDIKVKELSRELGGSQFVIARVFGLMKNMIEHPSKYGFEVTRWPCCPTQKNGMGLCTQEDFSHPIYGVVPSIRECPQSYPDPEMRPITYPTTGQCTDIPTLEYLKEIKKTHGIPKDNETCAYSILYVFYDELHMTEAANTIIGKQCFDGTDGICSTGIKQLAGA